MALIVVDASVLIALLDPGDALHPAAMAALTKHAGDDLKVPASAYSESLVGPARRGHLAAAKRAIASLLMDVVPITALVVATGTALSADRVLTGDAGWRRLGKTVSIL